MEGIIDAKALSFAFIVSVNTFKGFNNGLQQQHFYENYLETDKYPDASFSGKIIESVDLTKPGTYEVRAKGQLHIHGRSQERIIKVLIVSTGTSLEATTDFSVPLTDHQITVPKIVNQKIAREIAVTVRARMTINSRS
jgi:polyisoprenoid-binding protein YceI